MNFTNLIDAANITDKHFKISPFHQLIIANDKVAETFFCLTDSEFDLLKNDGTFEILEKTSKNHGAIITPIQLSTVSETPFNQFDRAILSVMMSKFLSGDPLLTVNSIYRSLCGKLNLTNSVSNPTEAQRNAIMASIDTLRLTDFKADLTDLTKYLNYNNHEAIKFSANVLSCEYIQGITVNGQKNCALYQINALSPIYAIAQLKKQLLTCDIKLLDVPKQHNSVDTIGIKHYILQRVLEIKLHNLTPTITFADVIHKCGLTNLHNRKKTRIRQYINSIMDHLKKHNEIISFESVKLNGIFHSIKFTYNK